MVKNEYPYKEYEDGRLWKVIEKSLEDLMENQDIEITTEKSHVVGYICKMINKEFGGTDR